MTQGIVLVADGCLFDVRGNTLVEPIDIGRQLSGIEAVVGKSNNVADAKVIFRYAVVQGLPTIVDDCS